MSKTVGVGEAAGVAEAIAGAAAWAGAAVKGGAAGAGEAVGSAGEAAGMTVTGRIPGAVASGGEVAPCADDGAAAGRAGCAWPHPARINRIMHSKHRRGFMLNSPEKLVANGAPPRANTCHR